MQSAAAGIAASALPGAVTENLSFFSRRCPHPKIYHEQNIKNIYFLSSCRLNLHFLLQKFHISDRKKIFSITQSGRHHIPQKYSLKIMNFIQNKYNLCTILTVYAKIRTTRIFLL